MLGKLIKMKHNNALGVVIQHVDRVPPEAMKRARLAYSNAYEKELSGDERDLAFVGALADYPCAWSLCIWDDSPVSFPDKCLNDIIQVNFGEGKPKWCHNELYEVV